MKKLILSTLACTLLYGCATPYQYTSDPKLSVPANIIADQSNVMYTDVGDGINGEQAKYHRGSLGTLFNLGLAATGAAKPIPGLSPALSSVVFYNAGVDTSSPMHRQPLVFAYWPYSVGDNEVAGTQRFMSYVDEAVNRTISGTDGSVAMITNDMRGNFKINAWRIVSPEHGCTEENACVLNVNIRGKSYEGYQPADWFLENGDYNALLQDVSSPVVAEGAKYATAWSTVNNGGSNRSQFILLQDNIEENSNIERLYAEISNHLPKGFFLYIPPEKAFGIKTDFPYMVSQGKRILFESP